MKRPLPRTPAQWLKEIKLAVADAASAVPFAPLVGTEIAADNLFHLAPVVCLTFRGKKLKGREADRVTKVALANYVANSDPEAIRIQGNVANGWLTLRLRPLVLAKNDLTCPKPNIFNEASGKLASSRSGVSVTAEHVSELP